MSKNGTVILPIAGRSSRFPGVRPKWMLTAPNGKLMLNLSLDTIADWRDRRVVIGGLREHLETLSGAGAIRRALGDGPEIVVFDEVTAGPAATVAEIITRADIHGPIFVKDCDSWFNVDENVFDDVICLLDIRTQAVDNLPGKSFIQLNENNDIANVVEKSVCSNYISVGGYGFREAETFLARYQTLLRQHLKGEPFVSHVILESMREGTVFRGVNVTGYEDVGTAESWFKFRERSKVLFVDIDGVVFRNAGEFTPPLWEDPDLPLPKNVALLQRLANSGAQLIFVTARSERFKEKTEAALRAAGLTWHAIIFGVNHARRVLINDFAGSNPYPSAVAINLARDADDLERML